MGARKCAQCGRSFEGRRDAKYCGAPCRAAAHKAARQSRSKAQRQGGTKLATAFTKSIAAARKAGGVSRATGPDTALVELARTYAKQIDADPSALKDLGPQLRLVLTELHMTPKSRVTSTPPAARGGVVGGGDGHAPDWLDEQRRERDARQNGTAAVDPAAT